MGMRSMKLASKTAERRELESKLVAAIVAQSKIDGTAISIKNR